MSYITFSTAAPLTKENLLSRMYASSNGALLGGVLGAVPAAIATNAIGNVMGTEEQKANIQRAHENNRKVQRQPKQLGRSIALGPLFPSKAVKQSRKELKEAYDEATPDWYNPNLVTGVSAAAGAGLGMLGLDRARNKMLQQINNFSYMNTCLSLF